MEKFRQHEGAAWPVTSNRTCGRGNIKILLSTGEVSGDLTGAALAGALRSVHPDVFLWGLGGDRMKRAGVHVLYNSNHMGSVGISEPLVTIPSVLRSVNRIRWGILKCRPDLAVLIGYDVFNLLLSRWLRAKKIPTVSYFPPQVWLWKGIAPLISRSYDWILTSFLEEDRVYRQAGAETVFVGHYLRDRIGTVGPKEREKARKSLGIGHADKVVGLLPGSRHHELDKLTPVLLDIAHHIVSRNSRVRFIMPVADRSFEAGITRRITREGLDPWVHLRHDSRKAMPACDLAILCSGTATLEAALMELPMMILYQVSPLSWMAVNLLEKTGLIASKTVGLPNLLAGRRIVPEYIQSEVQPRKVADEALEILGDVPGQNRIKENLAAVCSELGERGGTGRAARVILEKALPRPGCLKE